MEWLNSVWRLLTTENEFVTKVITAPTVFIEVWLIFKLLTSILKISFTKRQAVICILLLSFNSLITEFLIPTPFNILTNYLIMFTIVKSCLCVNTLKTVLFTIIPTVVFALIGIFILKPILIIFNISSFQAQNTPIYKLIYLATTYIIVFIIIKISQKTSFNLLSNEDFDNKNKKIILVNLVLGFFTIGTELAITSFYSDVLPFSINILNFLSLSAYFFISFYSLIKTMKLQITTRNLENAESYNNTLSFLYDNVKAFKHDFDNMIFTIGGFVNTNDIEGLKKYYQSLEKDCEHVNNVSILNPQLINNAGIYNLLTAKYQKAIELNVEIQIEFFIDLNKLHMPIYDFSRMLGILIDNAIEAASNTSEKIVKLTFRDSSNSNIQIVKIENTFTNINIDTNKIFEKGFTEKKNHSGMGLWEVKQIIKRNNNIKLLTTTDNHNFMQTLEIYY